MPTISLCMIVKNVAPYIHHCLESIVPFVNEVVIVDTGSDDETKARIQDISSKNNTSIQMLSFNPKTHPKAFIRDAATSWKAKVPGPFTSKKFLADFAAARNFGWRKATCDFSIWLDADDVFENAERLPYVLENMQQEAVDVAMMNYDYTTDNLGRVTMAMRRERVVRNSKGMIWMSPIHESMPMIGKVKFYNEVNVSHRRSQLKIPAIVANRNLKLLTKWVEDQESLEKSDPRMIFYLATEERFLRPDDAVEHFNLYIRKSGWDEERAVAHCYVGELHEKANRLDDALKSFAAAQLEFDNRPEGHLGAARIAYWKKDWAKCVEWTERGLAIAKDESRSSMMFFEPLDRTYRPYIYYSVALANLGAWGKVVEACEAGLAVEPEDPHLRGNLELAQAKLSELPQQPISPTLDGSSTIAFRVKGRLGSGKPISVSRSLDITIWTGQAWEKWDARSMNTTGIGGSETAAVHMANSFTKLGHRVTVVCDCDVEETVDGVVYAPFYPVQEGLRKISGDVCVVSRQAWAINYAENFQQRYLWVHDVHAGKLSPGSELGSQLARYDRIFALSPWHEQFLKMEYPTLAHKIWVTRNGIDTSRFASEPVKNGNRLVYSSSWDRGLELLLKLLPQIRKKVPDVKLDVFYGSKLWKDLRPDEKPRIELVEAALSAAEKNGTVLNHGRQPQDVLAKAFLAAKIWLYPTWFTETYCITALEAMAGGCVPVTVKLAGLESTVKHGVLVGSFCDDVIVQKALVNHTVKLLNDESVRLPIATAGRDYVMNNCDWAGVAKEWEDLFLSTGLTLNLAPVAIPEEASPPIPLAETPQINVMYPPRKIPTLSRKHRVAVMMGRLGSATHGIYNIDTLFDEGFMTGTGSNFFNIAWGLAERGHTVDVFCQTTQRFLAHPKLGGANVYNIDEPGIAPDDTYDAYISINEPDLLRQAPAKAFRACAMWLNDWSYTQAGFDEFVDLYVCPSWTHARYIRDTTHIVGDKLTVIYLSTNAEWFSTQVERVPGRMVYCSSPDRGLHHVLGMWPEIRTRAPQATLEVYYLIQPWLDFMAARPNKDDEIWRRASLITEQMQNLGTKGENGVTVIGPVSAKKMAAALLASHVFVYPCDPVRFTEGFSVSIMDACMAGCVPIIAPVDALPEVYGGVAHMISGNPASKKGEWINAVVGAIGGDGKGNTSFAGIGASARAYAATHTRQKMAHEWEALIEERRKK